VTPLRQLLNDDFLLEEAGKKVRCGFPGTNTELTTLRAAVDDTKSTPQARLERSRLKVDHAEGEMRRLATAMSEILLQMQGIITQGELVSKLNQIKLRNAETLRQVEEQSKKVREDIFRDLKDEKK
jgi:hypothetical protein